MRVVPFSEHPRCEEKLRVISFSIFLLRTQPVFKLALNKYCKRQKLSLGALRAKKGKGS